MIIGSILKFNVWDGGSGTNNRQITIGYCKETRQEVLSKLIKTHCIMSYGTSYCNPIEEYPANVEGLCIYDVDDNNMKGIEITGHLNNYVDDKFMKRAKWDKFNVNKFNDKINKLNEYVEHFQNENMWKPVYTQIVKEFKDTYEELK